MDKPQRIFNCDSGWCIDLDMVTYIGIPDILGAKVILKIGMDSNMSKENKDLFIIHEQNFANTVEGIHDVYKKKLLDYSYKEALEKADYLDKKDIYESFNGGMPLISLGVNQAMVYTEIDNKINNIIDQYLESEFKTFHNKLKSAFNKWVNYKESLREL